jgi:AmiR/NasT family two-component response regulator
MMFCLYLAPSEGYRTSKRYAQPVEQTSFRVVIAEDEALIRLDLKEMLEEESITVVGEAADGAAAVALAEQLRPDLVIMDVKMPVLDGISAAEQVSDKRLAAVVILTAFSQRELVRRASDAGAMAYLVKPFTKADLIPAIEIAVSRFQQVAALEAEAGNLRERLEVRKLLDRAKGVLQAERQLTEPEAFRWIQKASMDRRVSMRVVAEEVLAGASAGQPAPAQPAAGEPAPQPVSGATAPAQPAAEATEQAQQQERSQSAAKPASPKPGPPRPSAPKPAPPGTAAPRPGAPGNRG